MIDPRIEQAESLRNLRAESAALSRELRRLTSAAAELETALCRYQPDAGEDHSDDDPTPALCAIGQVRGGLSAVNHAGSGIDDALSHLRFGLRLA